MILRSLLLLGLLTLPGRVCAHSFGQVYTLPVPFWMYASAAVATLVLSFLIVGAFLALPDGKSDSAHTPNVGERRVRAIPSRLLAVLKAASFLSLLLCIFTGLFGTPSPYGNFNMTFFWIVFVLGFTYLTALVGDWYALINPWRLLCEWTARAYPAYARPRWQYPAWLGYWPALLLYAALVWIELFGGSSPYTLALLLFAYTLLNLVAVGLVGANAWFAYGEVFAVLLKLIARLAPVEVVGRAGSNPPGVRWRWPGQGLLGREHEHPSLLLFVLFMLSATAFDGLHETRPWVGLYWTTLYRDVFSHWLGSNPLAAFPLLRSYYLWWQSAWLLLSPVLYLAAYLFAIELMRRLARSSLRLGTLAMRFAHSLLPIVIVYHVTHYYTLIETQGIKILALASDPFGWGWNLFGTADWFPGQVLPNPSVVWHVQVALILLGHVASVVIAHLEALRVFADRRRAALSQLPMLLLMVLFTVCGLWILSLPLDGARLR